MKKNKSYVGIMKIHKQIEEEKLKEEMKKFVGKIIQMPPVKSRVKRQERVREVYSWEILEFDKEKKEVLFSCEVEAGTYVRKIISDLGLRIGGAHMIELRRIKAGIFSENDRNFVNLYELEKIKDNDEELKKIIIPADEAMKKILPCVQVKEEAVKKLLTGKPLFGNEIVGKLKSKQGENFVLFFRNKFIGVYRKVEEEEITARAEFVFN